MGSQTSFRCLRNGWPSVTPGALMRSQGLGELVCIFSNNFGGFRILTGSFPVHRSNTTKYNIELSNFEQRKEVQLKTQLKCLWLPTVLTTDAM